MEYPRELPQSLVEALHELKENPSPEIVKKINEIKERELETNEIYRDFVERRKQVLREHAEKRKVEGNPRQFENEIDEKYKGPGFRLPLSSPDVMTTIICCPKCFRLNTGNTTTKLNRKQRRSKPMVDGYPAHVNAYCFHCNSRMVHMNEGERLRKIEERYEKQFLQ